MPPKETSGMESQRKGGLEGSRTELRCISPRCVPAGPQGNGPPHSWSHLLLNKTELHCGSISSVEQCSLHSLYAEWGGEDIGTGFLHHSPANLQAPGHREPVTGPPGLSSTMRFVPPSTEN